MSDQPDSVQATPVPPPVSAILIPVTDTPLSHSQAFPAALGGISRSGDGNAYDELINHRVVHVTEVYDLSAKHSRSTDASQKAQHFLGNNQQVLALEAEDGTTLFLSPEQLRERLSTLPGSGFESLDLSKLRDTTAASRGLGDWIWSKLSVLELVPDSLVAAAKDKALEYLEERLGEELREKLGDLAVPQASWLGAKALMHVVESKLAGEPGLYQWKTERLRHSDRVDPSVSHSPYQGLVEAAQQGKPILVFIHGTASHTFGSFGDLRSGKDGAWEQLTRCFGEHVYGFEHRTFSQSPIENVLELVELLPKNTTLSVVTHSRGGLVGDLLCLGNLKDAEIKRYYHKAPLDHKGSRKTETDVESQLRERLAKEEQAQLCRLRQLLGEKQFTIQRYVRVACPAAGTSILSENLDVFCSSLLSLFNMAASMVPVVGGVIGSNILSVVRRLVLEIVQKRIDPHLIPGLEAMLPDSPLAALLAQASRRDNIKMAVISGDAEGGALLKRIITLFADWVIFDNFDHDLVVDSQSMRGGLARRGMTYECFVRGGDVSHVHYFMRDRTRAALYLWLTHQQPETLPGFNLLPMDSAFLKEVAWEAPTFSRDVGVDTRPILFYLPGLMGSHLEVYASGDNKPGEGNRIWFDPTDLFVGGLSLLTLDEKHPNVRPEGIFSRYYGDLADHLTSTFQVIPFAYDWRDDLHKAAADLANKIRQEMAKQPQRPIILLAHSMGGLVARLMIALNADLWDEMVKRPGCRFVMLGTPNHGSHMVVEALLGKADSVRNLARFDFRHDMNELLGIIGGFTGLLQLLPRPGFQDVGMDSANAPLDYFQSSAWRDAKGRNQDRWFGDALGAEPSDAALQLASKFWAALQDQTDNGIKHAQQIAYVFGADKHTPCGLTLHEAERWQMLGTQQGDGTVTWESGKLPGLANTWFMPVDHARLTCDKRYFNAITALLLTGKTDALTQQLPSTSRGMRSVYPYEPRPVLRPSNEELEMAFFRTTPQRELNQDLAQALQVSVYAMDLRFTQHPIICGHYLADGIAGTEAQIDQHLLDGALTQRSRLGIYAGDSGTNTIVLKARSPEDRKRGTRHGAIIVGLGEWNTITAQTIAETVRDGVLEYLLYSAEHDVALDSDATIKPLILNSLLVGYNSTAHISIVSSIDAIVRGVCAANQQFRNTKLKPGLCVGELRFVEFFLDTAITAAHAVRELPLRVEKDLERLEARVIPASELKFYKEAPRQRLSERSAGGYWARLMITNDDDTAETNAIAKKLKYVFLSERARAEAIEHMRQPGLIEALIREQVTKPSYDPDVCRTLFQLMIPLDFKTAARQTEQLLLVLDAYTANLPWEMLQADDEPLALKMAMVRQLVALRYRKTVRGSLKNTACVIGNPATTGFFRHYPVDNQPRSPTGDGSLASLRGATEEAHAVAQALRTANYAVETLYPASPNAAPEHTAIQVFNTLFKRSYRILMIAAHGVVGIVGKDGVERSGVVLSDGVMITAAEVGQMEVVPDLVFLNCCHLGEISQMPYSNYNRLAYGVSRELIEMGVRCVIAAGWAVDDQAAKHFSTEFFRQFVECNQPFGTAVFRARKHVHQNYPNSNTWGAYQAYGDPAYVLDNSEIVPKHREFWTPVAPQELLIKLEDLRIGHQHCANASQKLSFAALQERISCLLKAVPSEWLDKPDVQYKLGHVYAEWGCDGYEAALEAYRKAIQADSRNGQVPLAAFEQLSNIEVRHVASLSQKLCAQLMMLDASQMQDPVRCEALRQDLRQYPDWLKRIDKAVERLENLFALQPMDDEAKTPPSQAERYSLIGSAWKRKAQVQANIDEILQLLSPKSGSDKHLLADLLKGESKLQKKLKTLSDWSEVAHSLTRSSKAYKKGENMTFNGEFNAYPLLNRLQLQGVLDPQQGAEAREKHMDLARQAQAHARQRFQESYDFFDAVMAADADVALYLLKAAHNNEDVERLVNAYQEAMHKVSKTARELGSVIEQLRFLARLTAMRDREIGSTAASPCSTILDKVAKTLQNYQSGGSVQ